MITLLWAQTKSGVIGRDGQLPWNIKAEMQHFVNYTRGKTVLMGRNTWESLHIKPLPKRKNIVITSRPLLCADSNLEVTDNLKKFIKDFKNGPEELIIIGGSKIYESIIKDADKLVVSYIYQEYLGDTYAPKFDLNDFDVISVKKFDEFEVITYERKK